MATTTCALVPLVLVALALSVALATARTSSGMPERFAEVAAELRPYVPRAHAFVSTAAATDVAAFDTASLYAGQSLDRYRPLRYLGWGHSAVGVLCEDTGDGGDGGGDDDDDDDERRDTRGRLVVLKLLSRAPFWPREPALLDRLTRDAALNVPRCYGAFACDADAARAFLEHRNADVAAAMRADMATRASRFYEQALASTRRVLVLEYVVHSESWWLDDVRGPSALPWRHVRRLAYQMLRPIAAAHRHGIVHRDVKRYNYWVTTRSQQRQLPTPPSVTSFDPPASVRLGDWGQANVFWCGGSGMSPRVATPEYKAPELLLLNRHYHYAADVWAYGIVLGYLLHRQRDWLPAMHCYTLRECWSNMVFLFGTRALDAYAERHRRVAGDGALDDLRAAVDAAQARVASSSSSSSSSALEQRRAELRDGSIERHLSSTSRSAPVQAGVSDDGYALLRSLLALEADERPTADEALEHAFFDGVRDGEWHDDDDDDDEKNSKHEL